MTRPTVWICCLLAAITPYVSAQTFTDATNLVLSPPAQDAKITGVALADFNADGLLDIYHEGRLLRQQADGTFLDVRQRAAILVEGSSPQGGIWGDADGDGLLDLMLLDTAAPGRLYRNVTGSRFEPAESELTLIAPPPLIDAFWGDFDVDGRLDLFLASPTGDHLLLLQSDEGSFSNHARRVGTITGGSVCGVSTSDADNDGDLDLLAAHCQESGGQNSFLENIPESQTFVSRSPERAGMPTSFPSTSSVWLDYDNDGLMDVYVTNQNAMTVGPNQLYRGTGSGSFASPFFENVTEQAGVAGPPLEASQAAIATDFDNDGWTDIFVMNDGAEPRLYRNRGDGSFQDLGTDIYERVPTGPVVAAGDLNGDGWIDLFAPKAGDPQIAINKGGSNHWLRFRLRQTDGNVFAIGAKIRVRTGQTEQTGIMADMGGSMLQNEAGVLHFGLGISEMADEVRIEWPDGSESVHRDIAANQEVQFVKNVGRNEPPGNFDITGPQNAAFIDTTAGTIRFEWQPAPDADSDPVTYTLHLDSKALSLSIPNLEEPFHELDTELLVPDQQYSWTVVARDPYSVHSARSAWQFSFGSPGVVQGVLQQPVFFEYGLPPTARGLVRFVDFDTDGDEDLFLAGSNRGTSHVTLLRSNSQRIEIAENVFVTFKRFEVTGRASDVAVVDSPRASWFDVDGDNDPDLVMTGIEIEGGRPRATLYTNDSGTFKEAPGAGLPDVWGGVLYPIDFDGDGDLDLLIGGSVDTKPPYRPRTHLLINERGRFVESEISLPGLMFAASAWGDIDGDGDPDLVLSGDPVDSPFMTAVFENTGGELRRLPIDLPGLARGSLDMADIDGDGDSDLMLSGARLSPELLTGVLIVYENDGFGGFSPIQSRFEGTFEGRSLFADYENDGDPDIFTIGARTPNGDYAARLYRNENGLFSPELDLNGLVFSDIDIADYNGDGDRDLVLIGQTDVGEPTAQFFINVQTPEFIPPN